MATARNLLDRNTAHVAESLGVRTQTGPRPPISPVPQLKDLGRRPHRGFGRMAIEQVMPDPDQPRTEFSAEAESGLAESLQTKGQLHPIHVRWSDDAQRWVIISGERRWRAAKRAGLTSVDCFFHEQPLTRSQVLELQLIENLLREDLSPMEVARGIQSLMELNGWTGKQVAQSLRIPESSVSRSLALLRLPSEIQDRIETGEVSARSGYELSRVSDDRLQSQLADQAASGTLTHRDISAASRKKPDGRRTPESGIRRTFFAEHGWTVTVSSRQPGTYHHLEQALVEVLEEVRLRIASNVRL